MIILSLHHGGHDASVTVADDYDILSAIHTERITRVKGDGKYGHHPAINAALDIAGVKMSDVEVLLAPATGKVLARCFDWRGVAKIRYAVMRLLGKERRKLMQDNLDIFNPKTMMAHIGVPPNTHFQLYNHHYAHALSALFFTDWQDALLYTADGGGDSTNYSAYHFNGKNIEELHGDLHRKNKTLPPNSVGMAYAYMTEALGYRPVRHEGKLTGLAAYGEPVLYDDLKKHFWVDEDGVVRTPFSNQEKEMREVVHGLAAQTTPENAAASVQKLLEEIILQSITIYLKKTGARKIGMAGGVFANVSLNRRVAELPDVDEVFVFPAMSDDGVSVGGLYEYLLQRDGLDTWLQKRRRLPNVYLGGAYDDEVAEVFAEQTTRLDGEPAAVAAELLANDKIVALYCGRMEFGPRALGARSILASATEKSINDTLNKRLTRTEFMPFAPVVLAEDADSVFHINDTNRYAARFMTITCLVRDEWRDKIPAVVHVDGTARPQIIEEAENPLYAAILRQYKEKTGIPVLINTSFNAHEEPIINTPQECLRALLAGRVDYVAAKSGVYKAK